MAQRASVNHIDLVAGLAVVAVGALAAWMATDYGIGSARRMGAGFFPLSLGLLLVGLGGVLALSAVLRPSADAPLSLPWRQVLFVTLAFLIFALGIDPLGLPVTVFLATALACLGDRRATLFEAILLGAGVSLAIFLVFVVMLGLSLPVQPAFLGGA